MKNKYAFLQQETNKLRTKEGTRKTIYCNVVKRFVTQTKYNNFRIKRQRAKASDKTNISYSNFAEGRTRNKLAYTSEEKQLCREQLLCDKYFRVQC